MILGDQKPERFLLAAVRLETERIHFLWETDEDDNKRYFLVRRQVNKREKLRLVFGSERCCDLRNLLC